MHSRERYWCERPSRERYPRERHSRERHSRERHPRERHPCERSTRERHSRERHSRERHSRAREIQCGPAKKRIFHFLKMNLCLHHILILTKTNFAPSVSPYSWTFITKIWSVSVSSLSSKWPVSLRPKSSRTARSHRQL